MAGEREAYDLLEQRVEERSRALAAVLDVSGRVLSTHELPVLLGEILEQLQSVIPYKSAFLLMVEGDDLVLLEARGSAPRELAIGVRVPLARGDVIWHELVQGRPVIIADVRDDSVHARDLRRVLQIDSQSREEGPLGPAGASIRSWLGVPLMVNDRIAGMLVLHEFECDAYRPWHADLALTFANQAAIAIENVRLYTEAQRAAALEERQRLARDLHDSATQTIYAITMLAETARILLSSGNAQAAADCLRDIGDTAREALQDMRRLLFELRPPVLETEGLAGALESRLASVEARAGLSVVSDIDHTVQVPPDVEEAFFYIAQEALNNAGKHAGAGTVSVSLRQEDGRVMLVVADDGGGFDQESAGDGGGWGVGSMRERASAVGARLTLQSTPGEGTAVSVEVRP